MNRCRVFTTLLQFDLSSTTSYSATMRPACIVVLFAAFCILVASGLNLDSIRESMCSNGNTMVVERCPLSQCQERCEKTCKYSKTIVFSQDTPRPPFLSPDHSNLSIPDPRPPICDSKSPPTIENGCICMPGYIRKLDTDNCVLPRDC